MQEHLSNTFPKGSFPESSQKVQIISLSPTLLGYKITAIDHVLIYISHCLNLFLQELLSGAG